MKASYPIIVLALLSSCDRSRKIKKGGKPDNRIYSTKPGNTEMPAAMQKAKESIAMFDMALLSDTNISEVAIRAGYDHPGGTEYIWVKLLDVKDGIYYGVIDNKPEYTNTVKFGDTVVVKKEEVTDWAYVKNGVLKGGYTLKALRKMMTPADKDEFDAGYDFRIED